MFFFKVEQSKTSRTHCEWISSLTRATFMRKLICISSDQFVYTFKNGGFTLLYTQKRFFVTHMTVPSWAIQISEVKWLQDTDHATNISSGKHQSESLSLNKGAEMALESLESCMHCHPFSCFCLCPVWTQEATNLELRLPPYILSTQSKLLGQISKWHLHSLFKTTLKNV